MLSLPWIFYDDSQCGNHATMNTKKAYSGAWLKVQRFG